MIRRGKSASLGLQAAVVLSLLLAACGSSGGTSTRTSTLAPMDDGTTDLLVEAGATEEEARCINAATADAADPEAKDPESISRSITEAITSLATECASQDRLADIGSRMAVLVDEELAGALEPIIQQVAGRYEAAGAQPDEARCIAQVLLRQSPESLSNEGNAEARAEEISEMLMTEARECAAPQRLRKLTNRAFVSPLLSNLREAGASQKEATCIVDKIESIEIFFPSEDFNGPDSAEMASDRFVENAPGCARPERLRNIVRTLFKQYVEGCTKSSDDPMAPYDC